MILAESLTKRYGDVTALEECSLSVEGGEIYGLLGPNGAGKTTLLRLMVGFLRPTSGRASIGGFDCSSQSIEVRHLTSYLPAEARLFRGMRGRDVLAFFSETRAHGDVRRAREIAERLDLELDRRVAFMSTGMRQKLALAVVLSADTPLLILDEPTANLDPTVRAEVLAMVSEAKRQGRTILFSSHVLSEVEQACDRVAILRAGRVVHSQAVRELQRHHRVHASFHEAIGERLGGIGQQFSVVASGDREITLETENGLPELLAWLGSMPLSDVRIEQVGLRSIYERYHASGSSKVAGG